MKTIHIAVVVLLLLAGCSSKLEKEFIQGCKSTGGGSSYCSCMYKKLEPELLAAEKNPDLMLGDKFKAAFQSSMASCRS